MKIISIANQKGGVGKTSTALALIDGLTIEGYKVLGVDLDSQGNLTASSKAVSKGATALSLLTQEAEAINTIQKTPIGDIIPYNSKLSNIEALLEETGKEYKLKESLETLTGYDYIIIDTPPALSLLTINSLTASDYVIVPAQADLYSLQGVDVLTRTINTIKKYTNPKLKVAGILITMFTGRVLVEKQTLEIIESLAEDMGTKVFNSTIRTSCKVREAPYSHQGIISYAPKSTVAEDYRAFIRELHARGI